jgi:hypothetical protein
MISPSQSLETLISTLPSLLCASLVPSLTTMQPQSSVNTPMVTKQASKQLGPPIRLAQPVLTGSTVSWLQQKPLVDIAFTLQSELLQVLKKLSLSTGLLLNTLVVQLPLLTILLSAQTHQALTNSRHSSRLYTAKKFWMTPPSPSTTLTTQVMPLEQLGISPNLQTTSSTSSALKRALQVPQIVLLDTIMMVQPGTLDLPPKSHLVPLDSSLHQLSLQLAFMSLSSDY